MLVDDEVTANLRASSRTTTAQKIPHLNSILAACFKPIDLLISSIVDRRHGIVRSKKLLDLNEAQTLFGIDRDILLTAIANNELSACFKNNKYLIKYKDLEQFVDRYFYHKDSLLGGYSPNLDC